MNTQIRTTTKNKKQQHTKNTNLTYKKNNMQKKQ